jgi:hypothetical protein
MTSHVGRLYSLAVALVVFFGAWAVVAAHPWVTPKADPRLAILAARERQLRHESTVVRSLVEKRWAVYRAELQHRQAQISAVQQSRQLAAAAAPAARIVTLPPLTVTRTS